MIGVAAHIAAAAPGGRRYDSAMTPEARKAIGNAIWLCQTCARAIDWDEATYTTPVLLSMKTRHEETRSFAPKSADEGGLDDVIALGSRAYLLRASSTGLDAGGLRLTVRHFIKGDPLSLSNFVASFHSVPSEDRYVLVNQLGEGFLVPSTPALERVEASYILKVPHATAAPRKSVHRIGSTMALDETGDVLRKTGALPGCPAWTRFLKSSARPSVLRWASPLSAVRQAPASGSTSMPLPAPSG